MKVVVTGGAGFIGSNLVDALTRRGDDVTVLDNLVTGYADNVIEPARLVVGDVTDEAAVAGCVEGAEVVFHLAAARSVARSVELPVETDRVNAGGTLTVLDSARRAGVRRVVTTSSSSVYGGLAAVPTPEDAPLRPRSPYAVSKMAGEHYSRVYWELFGLETVTLRPFNVFGPRQRPDSAYAAVIPIFIDALRRRRAPVVHGDGRQSRDFTYVADTVTAFVAAADAPASSCAGKVYNVAGGGEHTLMDLLDVLYDLTGVRCPPEHTEPRPGDVRRSCGAAAAAAADLGWSAQTSFKEGLARTIAWMARR